MKTGDKRLVLEPHMTHQEIADQFGISRAAVSDMEQKALRKLRKALEKNGYKWEDFFDGTEREEK
jgi:DNA-directed RNA polymerase sigma subunit (sigma70/sigma32)